MSENNMAQIAIEGTITLEDYVPAHDRQSKFAIDSDGAWKQWGATTNRLCETTRLVTEMSNAIQEHRS